MTKKPFTSKGIKAEKYLELLHTNMCRLFNVQACGGYEYFITFTSDYSLFGYVYLMHRKSDGLDKFKEFKAESENQLSKHLKAPQSDWGGTYLSNGLDYFFKEHKIISQLSVTETPQQNGVVEIHDAFFNTSYILLGIWIYLRNCKIFS